MGEIIKFPERRNLKPTGPEMPGVECKRCHGPVEDSGKGLGYCTACDLVTNTKGAS